MQNLIEKITLDFGTVKGHEVAKILEDKKEVYITLTDDLDNAIEILKWDCFSNLKRSRKFWNKTVNERI